VTATGRHSDSCGVIRRRGGTSTNASLRGHTQSLEKRKGGPSMIRGINHVTLAVADLERALAFYGDVLGLRLAARWPAGAYLEAGSLWLCLSLNETHRTPRTDDTHLAFDVAAADFATLVARIAAVAGESQRRRLALFSRSRRAQA
jgi:catechol-2,3-dioxygenase